MSKSGKSLLCGSAAAAALTMLTVSGPARAQGTAPVSKPLTIKLGAFTPSSSDTRDLSGDTHFELSASYDIGKTDSSSPIVYGVYGDYIFQTSNSFNYFDPFDETGGTYTGTSSGYGIGVEGRYLLIQDRTWGRHRGGGGGSVTPYIGGGLGVYGSTAKFSQTDFFFDSIEGSKTVTALGGKLAVGVQSHSGFTGEINYQWLPTVGNIDMSGSAIEIGYRF